MKTRLVEQITPTPSAPRASGPQIGCPRNVISSEDWWEAAKTALITVTLLLSRKPLLGFCGTRAEE